MVDALAGQPGVYGARLTGGGFGGAVMALTSGAFTCAAAEAIGAQQAEAHGVRPEIIELHVADGARLVALD